MLLKRNNRILLIKESLTTSDKDMLLSLVKKYGKEELLKEITNNDEKINYPNILEELPHLTEILNLLYKNKCKYGPYEIYKRIYKGRKDLPYLGIGWILNKRGKWKHYVMKGWSTKEAEQAIKDKLKREYNKL